jgi:rhamnose transport system ATP-binding protein
MVGRDLPERAARGAAREAAPVVLAVDGLGRRPWFSNISLTVNAGEIVGLFGLVGSGRSELLETIFGLYPVEGGRMRVGGQELRPSSPRDAIRAGVVLVPEERQRQGLLFNLTVRHNLVLPERTARGGARRSGSSMPGASRRQAWTSIPTRSAAATSRRSSSPSGWRPRPR